MNRLKIQIDLYKQFEKNQQNFTQNVSSGH